MNTAELLVQCLENEGVEYIFGLPGEENLQLLQASKAVIDSVHHHPS
jgi:acetolactate synthase-1/2/3 large subunit